MEKNHEAIIRNAGKITKFDTFNQLYIAVTRLLGANKAIFDAFGPKSPAAQADPTSNSFLVWELRRIDRILSNNRKILNILDANIELIEKMSVIHAVEKFRVHVESYEKHVYHRLDFYQLFPDFFIMSNGSND